MSDYETMRLRDDRTRGGQSYVVSRRWSSRESAFSMAKQHGSESVRGFTLTELLVTMGVLVVLVLLFTQLLNSAATTMTLGNKRMDTDSQARQLLDRMAIDFDQMLKRSDVSYYVKTVANPQTAATQSGNPNDQIAFFSAVPGYYSQAGYNSNASLVAYRVNAASSSASYNQLERMGKGLALNGAYTTAPIPLRFLDGTPNTTILGAWPAAASSTGTDSDCNSTGCYETVGPQVFRFEYYYLLTSNPSVGVTFSNQLSAGPWTNTDTFLVKDVAAIVIAIAVIEPKSKVLLSNDQIATLAGTLPDFMSVSAPGKLLTQWQAALDANAIGLPRAAISGIRLYERYFYLSQ
jgi:prepilin-type N-terminal cleavage/methylation domain-containing protein